MPISKAPEHSRERDRFIQAAQFLYRPIVFQEPNRAVHPASWLEHIPFAFWLIDVLRPGVVVELGTHSGNSYAAFAQAIQLLGLPAAAYAIDTWKGDSQAGFYDESVFTEWSAYHDRHFSAFSRLVRTTFEDAAEHFPDGSVDLVHLDGCHVYDVAARDFAVWRPKLSSRGVMVIHDTNIRERDFGAWRLWEELKTQCPCFEFLHGHGLGVAAVGDDIPHALRWLLGLPDSSGDDVHAVRQFFARLGGAISARHSASEARQSVAELGTKVAQAVQRQCENHAAEVRAEREARAAEVEAERAARGAAEAQAAEARALVTQRDTMLAEHAHAARTDIAARDATIKEHAQQLVRLAGELHRTRAQLTKVAADLDDRSETLQRARNARAELEQQLRQRATVVAELQQRLRTSSEHQARTEKRESRTPAATTRAAAQQIRVGAGSVVKRPLRRVKNALRVSAALGLVPTRTRWIRPAAVRFLLRPARRREAHAVVATGLFDEGYYASTYPDIRNSRLTPLAHFIMMGASEGRKPHPLFDGAYYLHRNPDVASSSINPLLHYRTEGAFEGRNPHPLFDVRYYLSENPDVRSAGAEPLAHFLQFGATEGRKPNPFFDCAYYLGNNPDVAASGINPLVHFVCDGWRDGRRPSAAFDSACYLAANEDVRRAGRNPLEHYVEHGLAEGRPAVRDDEVRTPVAPAAPADTPAVSLAIRALAPPPAAPPTVLCLSHVMPFPPRAGNEYRIYRMLCWLRDRGYRIIPVVAPLPGDEVGSDAVRTLASHFSNAVLCDRDGRLEYVLEDVPDVLRSLGGETTRPISLLLDETAVRGEHQLDLLRMDRAFCHDVLITTVLRLQQVLGPHVLLAEYIWMSRILPLVRGDVLKVVDTIDVFSTKRDKVLRFGIADLHVEPAEEAKRLHHADLVVAIQEDERQELQRLLPGKTVVTAGVDLDVVAEPGIPSGRRILYVASGNPMNQKGLKDFLRFAWPGIRLDAPNAELLLAGRIGDTLEADVPGVVRLGLVDDLSVLYRQARVVINPAVAGTGLKIKTLEALAHLRPIVTWPSGTDGVAPELAALCVTVEDWYEFSREVTRILTAGEPYYFSDSQRAAITRLTTPEAVYGAMTAAIEAALEGRFAIDAPRPAATAAEATR